MVEAARSCKTGLPGLAGTLGKTAARTLFNVFEEGQWGQTLTFDTLFEHLREALDGGLETPSGKALAASLRMTESALKSAMFRLRARYGDILRQEVAQTVSHPGEVDDEIRHLLQVLNRG